MVVQGPPYVARAYNNEQYYRLDVNGVMHTVTPSLSANGDDKVVPPIVSPTVMKTITDYINSNATDPHYTHDAQLTHNQIIGTYCALYAVNGQSHANVPHLPIPNNPLDTLSKWGQDVAALLPRIGEIIVGVVLVAVAVKGMTKN